MIAMFWLLGSGALLQAAPLQAPDSVGQAYFLFIEGRLLEGRGDIDGAVRAYRQAVLLAPTASEIRAELAGLYARQGRAGEAVDEAGKALELDAGNREAHRILGFVQSALSDRRGGEALRIEAIHHFEQALAGGGRDPGAELTLGRLYHRAGQFEPAIKWLTTFLLDQRGYPEAMELLAEAYEGSGQPAQAAETWRELAGADPAGLKFRPREAMALVDAGQLDTAAVVLRGLTEQAPESVLAWSLLSEVERRLGDIDGATRAAERIRGLDGDDPRGLLAMAAAQVAAGDSAGAVATLEARVALPRASDIESGLFARMSSVLAEALQDRGETARAVEVLEAARVRAPDDRALAFALGAAIDRDGRFDAAERVFRELIGLDANHAEALNYLGYALADRNERLEEAVQLVSRALKVDPGNPSYLDSLGWVRFRLGDVDGAREPLERAAAARPRTSVIQNHIGDVYFQLKRFRDAADAFARALEGDGRGIDAETVAKKRDRARALAGRH